MEITEYIQLGATFVIAFTLSNGILKILEATVVKRMARNGDGPEGYAKRTLDELKLMNNNHLHTLEEKIVQGNKEIVGAIKDMHIDLLKELRK